MATMVTRTRINVTFTLTSPVFFTTVYSFISFYSACTIQSSHTVHKYRSRKFLKGLFGATNDVTPLRCRSRTTPAA